MKADIKLVNEAYVMDDDLFHRRTGYAYENSDGDQYWYLDGKLHRDDGKPAIVLKDKSQQWFANGREQAKPVDPKEAERLK